MYLFSKSKRRQYSIFWVHYKNTRPLWWSLWCSFSIHSQPLILYHTVMENAVESLVMVPITLQPEIPSLLLSILPFLTDHKNVLSTLKCLGVRTSHKMYFSSLWCHYISIVLSLFLLACSCFPKFITYLDHLFNW